MVSPSKSSPTLPPKKRGFKSLSKDLDQPKNRTNSQGVKVTNSKQRVDGMQALNIQLSYPLSAVQKRLQGVVVVEVTIAQGKVISHRLVQSSGHQLLDFAVTHALNNVTVRDHFTTLASKLDLVFEFKL